MPNEIMSFVSSRNFWVLSILVMILNAAKSLRRTPRHLKCEFSLFHDQAVISDYSQVNGDPDTFHFVNHLHYSNQAADHFQAHGVRANEQLPLPSAGWAVTTAEPGAVSEAAFRAPAAPTEGSYYF